MTNSLFEATVVRDVTTDAVRAPALTTELRSGIWTRLGDSSVLGDGVTESALQALAQSTRTSARAQGYAIGWSEGRQAAEERAGADVAAATRHHAEEDKRREAEHQIAIDALFRAAERLTASTAQVCASVETQAVDVAMRLTETLVGRELELGTQPGADAIRRALSLLPGEPLVTVRLNPQDVPASAVDDLAGTGVRVLADPALQRGDAVAEAADFVVDASIATALERVRKVLTR